MSRPVSSGPAQSTPGAVQFDEARVQRDVAVGVEFADRNAQPVGLVHLHDGVVGELTELGDAQPGARQHLDHEPSLRIEPDGGSHEPGGLVVVEELRQRLVHLGQVGPHDRVPCRRVGVVPFDESLEHDAQRRQSQMDRRFLQRFTALVLAGGEPELERLDVAAVDLAERDHGRVVIDEPLGEDPQARIDRLRRRRSSGHRDLCDVVLTRRREHRGVARRCVSSVRRVAVVRSTASS